MIEQRELEQLRGEWSLESGVIEKDYVLGWLLAGIAQHEALSQTWIFKGGTCLRKCYYETYRFSEDLDFTVTRGGPEDPSTLIQIFNNIVDWVRENSGLKLAIDESSFRVHQNRRGNPTIQGRIGYRGLTLRRSCPRSRLTSPPTNSSWIRPCCEPSAIPTAMGPCQFRTCSATRHRICSRRRCARLPSAAVPATSTT